MRSSRTSRAVAVAVAVAVVALALGPLPMAPAGAEPGPTDLHEAIAELSTALGAPVNPLEATLAALPAEVAGPLASTLQALLACHDVTQGALASAAGDPGRATLDAAAAATVRGCASTVDRSVAELETALQTPASSAAAIPALDLWPVLRLEPGIAANAYHHDYALLVDMGGDDLYDNNAGGNLLDLKRGPAGSVALLHEEARGCQGVGVFNVAVVDFDPPGVTLGQPNEFSNGECIPAAAALLDLGGNDQYGVLEAPGERDLPCTQDNIVRRVLIEGAGFAGVGLLRDVSGNDAYLGKVMTQGVGHNGGVGTLSDGGGDDQYLAVRYSQGFALLGASGELVDAGGNDTYDFYMPSGGLMRDGGCDATPGFTLGAATHGGEGALVDKNGDDSYRAALRAMGAGALGGTGTFIDCRGNDSYQGVAGRVNDVTVTPTADNTGVFIDGGC